MTTIHDVARRAGVSIKTVSRVVNDESNVRDSTKKRVEEAIQELDFSPHLGARSLRSKRTGLVAMITGGIFTENWVPFQTGLSTIPIVHGALRSLRSAGKTLLFADSLGNEDEFYDLVKVFRAHRVEGMIYSSTFHKKVAIDRPVPFPLVLVNCFDEQNTASVVPDDELGQRRVAEDMLAEGHRSIAMVGLPRTIIAGRLRRRGFLDAARQAGLRDHQVSFIEGSESDGVREINVLDKALSQTFGSGNPPTAVCFGNDLMAMRAIPVLEKMGIKPGKDIAVWGFDNDLTICDSVQPALTTMSLPYREMGIAAAETLMDIIRGNEPQSAQQMVCGKIIRRGSSQLERPRLVNL